MKHSRSIVPIFVIIFIMALCAPGLSAQEAATKININKATAEELTALKHVGPKLSQRIVEYREEKGAFQATEDIVRVPGVGPKVYDINQDIITVD